jgi:hypothetical protein
MMHLLIERGDTNLEIVQQLIDRVILKPLEDRVRPDGERRIANG